MVWKPSSIESNKNSDILIYALIGALRDQRGFLAANWTNTETTGRYHAQRETLGTQLLRRYPHQILPNLSAHKT